MQHLLVKRSVAKQSAIALGTSTALALTLGMAPQANAVSFNGSGGAIADLGFVTSDITVDSSNNFQIGDVTVTLNNLTHTFFGDLIATLENVTTSTTVTLFNRAGGSSDLGGNYSFNDSFIGNLLSVPFGSPIPGGNYFPIDASGTLSSPSLTTFVGQNAPGIWRLRISDNAGIDVGNLGSWSLALTPVTAVPSPALLPGLIGMGVGALRQRRKLAASQAKNI
jgi:subtilisin-like proprotein convertase family protein